MASKSVAVLDVRSASVTAMIGQTGVNNTFIFKGMQSEAYDGYENAAFYDEEGLGRSIKNALASAEGSANEHLRTVYVGVPGEFTKIVNKTHMVGFASPKRITNSDQEMLYREGFAGIEEIGYEKIHAKAMYFVTSDSRKVADATGIVSSTLQANVTYVLCSSYFTKILRGILTEYGFSSVVFLPSSIVQAQYLLSDEQRDAGAILLDIGMLSTTATIVYGNGILMEKTFWSGESQIAAMLYQELEIPFEDAVELVKNYNLYRNGMIELKFSDDRSYPTQKISEVVKSGLDEICEPMAAFLDEAPAFMATKPIMITGEGITGIRGMGEHISGRLSREIELVAPQLPYYNKPTVSSRISLMGYALEKREKEGFFFKLFNRFGG